ncbi:MAG: SMP-30/gluconolactonase/LRE family protein [Betaproteobacteria bacterium]|nr:SMP-30/gluconolactonase/LRE family protein [Betaproteobacteria bacterium]
MVNRHNKAWASVLSLLLLAACAGPGPGPSQEVRNALAPTGKLRVGVYPGSPTSMVRDASGERGVSVEMGRLLAQRLGVPYEQVEFRRVAEVVDGLKSGKADFTITNATPARAADLDFSAPVITLELGYLVPPASRIATMAEADRPGMRIGVAEGGTSHATLTRTLKQATVVPMPSLSAAIELLQGGRLDAFASNKGILNEMADRLPGSKILEGRWGLEHLAMAVPKGRDAGLAFLRSFADEAVASGAVASASERAGLRGMAKDVTRIPGVLAAGEEVELVREGFVFTEGPLPMTDGGILFTDLREANRIHRLHGDGHFSVVRERSGGTNGLAWMRDQRLVGAEGEGRRIVLIDPDGTATELSRGDGTTPLMAPNDLIADSKGGIYFTDPGPRPVTPGRRCFVYYLPAGASRAVVVDEGIARPNGLTLTLDEKTLVVDDTLGDTVFAFDVQPDGMLRNKRAFLRLRDVVPGEESVADGMAIDRDGRFYVTTRSGVQVFGRDARYLGTIKVPRQPANVAFGGRDKRTLYITAREGLYRVRTLAQGPDRLGK